MSFFICFYFFYNRFSNLDLLLCLNRGVVEGEVENNVDASANQVEDEFGDDPGTWAEDFKSHHDSKPNGPEAVAMDFTFPQAQVLCGK